MYDMVLHLISSTRCWAGLSFSLSFGISEINIFVSSDDMGDLSLKSMPRPQQEGRFALIVALTGVNICRNEIIACFFNNLLKKMLIEVVKFWPNFKVSSFFFFQFLNACLVITTCPADCLVF